MHYEKALAQYYIKRIHIGMLGQLWGTIRTPLKKDEAAVGDHWGSTKGNGQKFWKPVRFHFVIKARNRTESYQGQ